MKEKEELPEGRRTNKGKGSLTPFAMRNPVPSSRFHLLAVTLILSTVAVWPIGYTTAEANSLLRDYKVKRSVHQDVTSFITKRSSNFEKLKSQYDLQNLDMTSNLYGKFQNGNLMEYDEDNQYPQQTESFGSNAAGNANTNYENDGYGYDDEYDHFNYKRYDNDKNKLDENLKSGKEESNEGFAKDGYVYSVNKKTASAEQDSPKTTVELINFHAKNINPGENFQRTKGEEKVKDISFKKSLSEPTENRKESLSEEKAKKIMFNQAGSNGKAEDAKSNEESREVKSGSSKISGGNGLVDNSAKKVKTKADDNNDANQENVQDEKNIPHVSGSKENTININVGKNTKFDETLKNYATAIEKDCKEAEEKTHSETKEVKDDERVEDDNGKDYDSGITDVKVGNDNVKEDAIKEKNLSRFTVDDCKEYMDSMIDSQIVDNEKPVEGAKDREESPTQFRDHKSDVQCKVLERQDVANRETSKCVSKKDASNDLSDSKSNSHSCYSGLHMNWDSGKESPKNSYEHVSKEPLHLDFPLAELENTDYHRNFIKSLKRYKGIDESSRILNQGDISSPFGDKQNKEIPSNVIEEERKRRSRLRRLKSNEIYNAARKESENNICNDKTDKDCSSNRSEEEEPSPVDAKFGETELKRSGSEDKNRRRGTYDVWMDPYEKKSIEDSEIEETKIDAKNKRQNNVRLYERERSTHARDMKKVLDENERSREKIGMAPSKRKFYTPNDRNEGNYYYSSSSQRENHKDTKRIYDDSNQIRGPLFLLQKNDKGRDLMKGLTNRGSKCDSEIDSEDLARMLSKNNKYIVLRNIVPGNEQDIVCNQNGRDQTEHVRIGSNGSPMKMSDNYKITESNMIMKAHSPVSGEELDFSKIKGERVKGERIEAAFDKKENKIKDLTSFFKSKNQQALQRKNDENKAGETYPENNIDVLDLYQKSKQQDKSHNAPSSQVYGHIKNFDDIQQTKDMEYKMKDIFGERQLKTSKTTPNEQQNYFFTDKTLNPNEKEFQYANSNAKIRPDSGAIQLKIPENTEKGTNSEKYYLYDADNGMSKSPKHEIKVMQSDFRSQTDSPYNYNSLSNPQSKMFQNKIMQNLTQSGKMTFSSNAGIPNGGVNPGYPITQTNNLRHANSMTKQQDFNNSADYRRMPENTSEMKSNAKRMAKKVSKSYDDEFEKSGDLKRFIRDFQYFADQQNAENVIMPKTSLQELTGHGDKHLQELNNLLREIMNNKIINDREQKKNLKRGMLQKYYEDQKNWPIAGMETNDPQVGSGGWTSLVYEIPNAYHFEHLDRNRNVRELGKIRPAKKNCLTNLEGKANVDSVETGRIAKDNSEAVQNYFKRTKRNLKQIPKNLVNGIWKGDKEQSTLTTCASTREDNLSSLNRESIKERRSVKEERKNNFHTNPRIITCDLNKNILNENGRKLLSVSEMEPSGDLNDREKENVECLRKSLQNYLDPLARRINGIEYLKSDNFDDDKTPNVRRAVCKMAKCKREIKTDESLPDDFQNLCVTSKEGFGEKKNEMIHWESNGGSRDEFGHFVDEMEELRKFRKRDASWKKTGSQEAGGRSVRSSEERKSLIEKNSKSVAKKSVVKEKATEFGDGTNIKIRIVDGDFNGETKVYNSANTMNSEGNGSQKNQLIDIPELQNQRSEAVGQMDKNQLIDAKRHHENNRGFREIYVMDKKQIKNKIAGTKNDRINQKHQYSSRISQVQAVYNSDKGTNNAASSQQVVQPTTKYNPNTIYSYNSSISKLEDNILRNNLKVGNTKVYTYQASEEPTSCPVEEHLEGTKSNEFERIDTKNKIKTDIKIPTVDTHGYYNSETHEGSYFPDIVYKDDGKQLLTNMRKNPTELFPKQDAGLHKGENSNARVRENSYKNEDNARYVNTKPYENVSTQERVHVNPDPVLDMRNQMSSTLNVGQASSMRKDSSYATGEEKNGNQAQTSFPKGYAKIYGDAKPVIKGDNTNSKMIEAWNSYAKPQLTQSKLKGLANKEYLNYRRNFDFTIALAGLGKVREAQGEVKMSRDLIGSLDNFDSKLLKSVEKIGNGRLRKENSGICHEKSPAQEKYTEKIFTSLKDQKNKKYPSEVGKRFFYSFRSELPDEYYNFLISVPINREAESLVRECENVEKKLQNNHFQREQITNRQNPGANGMSKQISDSNVIGSYVVGKNHNDYLKSSIGNTPATGQFSEGKTDFLADSVSTADTSSLREKRWSSGHLTESHYRKYHKKIFNGKRETLNKRKNEVAESCTACEEVIRAKRDTFDEEIQADMQRRMQKERKIRDVFNYIDANKKLPLILPPRSALAGVNEGRNELGNKVSRVSESDALEITQQHTDTKTVSPSLYETYSTQRGQNSNDLDISQHTIVGRLEPEKYEDGVFVKGTTVRKARKFSDEGFERLTPDMRFSEKGNVNDYVEQKTNKKASLMQMPYNVQLLGKANRRNSIQNRLEHNNGVEFGTTRYGSDDYPDVMGIGRNNNDFPGMMAYNKNYYSEPESNNGYNDFSEMIAYNKKYNNRKMEENQGFPDKGNAPENAPKQKLIHALSHEAPLLTSTNFINQPTGYSNLQDASINMNLEKTTITKQSTHSQYPNEADLVVSLQHFSDPEVVRASSFLPEASQNVPLLKSNFKDSQTNEPIMGAFVLLAKKGQQNKRQTSRERLINKLGKRNAIYLLENKCPGWCPTDGRRKLSDGGKFYGEEVADRGRLSIKRSPRRRESSIENNANSDLRASDQTQGTVNESARSGSCGSDGDTETCNTNKTNNFKQPSFPLSQSQNIKTDTRNEQKDTTANCGEHILAAILEKVESNPQFRKIIGPGLKWSTKEERDKEEGCGQSKKCQKNDIFVLNLRKIMEKFMCDIEKLAEQEPKRSCSKLDREINQFLREMLEGSCGNQESPTPKPCGPQAEPSLRIRCMSKPCSNGNQNSNAKMMSLKDLKKKQNFIMKLLAEYQSLSQSDKKKMEPVGKYLEQQLEEIKISMNATAKNETCNSSKDKSAEDKSPQEKITGNKWSEDKGTEEKYPENKCPEGKDADNKNIMDSSSQNKCPKDKCYFEKKANNTCPEDATLETKISENKCDKNKSCKEDKDADNKREDGNDDDKCLRNECPKEKNFENTNIEDETTKGKLPEKNCNKTKTFEEKNAEYNDAEEKSSKSEYVEDNNAIKSGIGSYPEDKIAEESNVPKKEYKSEGNNQDKQAAVSYSREGQDTRSRNGPVSAHTVMQNINDASVNLPFIWTNPDDVNLLRMKMPEPSVPNFYKNEKCQHQSGDLSPSHFPSSKETYEEQMFRSFFPFRSNLAISAKKKHTSANYPMTYQRKNMGNDFEVESPLANFAKAEKFEDDSSEVSGMEFKTRNREGNKRLITVEDLQKVSMGDAANLQLSPKHQDPVDSSPNFDKTDDGSCKQAGALLDNEPMSRNRQGNKQHRRNQPEGDGSSGRFN